MNVLSSQSSQQQQQQLLCHCNQCPDNTCVAEQFGFCTAELRLEQDGRFTKNFDCQSLEYPPEYTPGDLVQKLMCDTNFTKTSNSFSRCCNSHNYCNQAKDFLDNLEGVKRELLGSNYDRLIAEASNSTESQETNTFDLYSNIPLEIKVALVVVAGILLVLLLALVQKLVVRARERRARALECDNQSDSGSHHTNLNVHTQADSNSTASEEPLLITPCDNEQQQQQVQVHQCQQHPLPVSPVMATSSIHPNPLSGPYMSNEKYLGREHSTLAVSIGSAEPHRSKQDSSTGSGSGHPYLHQRSIINDIELRRVIGRGKFGIVYRGDYKGEPVAVKIFTDSSWEREAEIYQTSLLRHKNILGFIASDFKTEGSFSGFWIVTDYHYLGSLTHFMSTSTLVLPDAIRMAFSIANGLAHMHTEIFGTQGKPAIAHRDIKSNNILVKSDGTCCIADLGMAARYNSKTNIVDLPAKPKLGTMRYLAPEILDNKLNLMDFEALKAADMYAVGLVFWEILRRTCYKYRSLHDLPELNFVSTASRRQPPEAGARHEPPPVSPPLVSTPAPFSEQLSQGQDTSDDVKEPLPNQEFPSDQPKPPLILNDQQPGPSRSLFHAEIEKHYMLLKKKQRDDTDSSEHLPELVGYSSTNKSQSQNKPQPQPQPQPQPEVKLFDTSSGSGEKIDSSSNLSNIGDDIIFEERMVESSESFDESSVRLDESSPEVSTSDSISKMSFDCEALSPPYDEYLVGNTQPTWAEMKEIVCVRKLRPSMVERWNKFLPMRDFVTLIKECWYEKPQARLSALRTRKTLGDIARFYFNLIL